MRRDICHMKFVQVSIRQHTKGEHRKKRLF